MSDNMRVVDKSSNNANTEGLWVLYVEGVVFGQLAQPHNLGIQTQIQGMTEFPETHASHRPLND